MARPYFELLVIELKAGDSISFTANGSIATFTCIPQSPVQKFEYIARSPQVGGLSPVSIIAVTIENDLPNYDVTVREQLVIVSARDELASSNFAPMTIINVNGSNVTLLKNVDDAGVDSIGVAITNGSIDVTLVKHEILDLYPAISKPFLFGSIGNLITTTIEFTILGTLDFLEFKFGLIINSQDPYTEGATGDDQFVIPQEFFFSNTSDVPNIFRGDPSSFQIANPLNHATGTAALTLVGGQDFRIVHTHLIEPLIRPSDLNGLAYVVPAEFLGPESIKYVFQISVKDDAINPDFNESTRFTDLTPFLPNGNVGAFAEFLNNQPGAYTLTSFIFDTEDGELNQAIDSPATAVIASTEALSVTDDIIVIAQAINAADDQTQTLIGNLNHERVIALLDTVPVSGTNLLAVTADFSGSDITLTFDVAAFAYTEDYAIYVIVSTDSVVINHNTVLLKIGSANKLADDSGIIMGTILGAPFDEFNINKHDLDLLAEARNHIADAFVGDRFVIRFLIENTDSTITISQFVTSIVSRGTNVTFDRVIVNIGDFDLDTEREFILESGSAYNFLKATQTINDFEFELGFQTWQTYVGFTDIVVQCEVIGTQLLADGTVLNVNRIFQTADFDVTTYNGTKNGPAEPQMEFKSITFTDDATGNPVKALVKNGITLVEIEHEDNNLNAHGITDPLDLRGYMMVRPENGQQLQERQFHNIHEPEADTPWSRITGHPSNNSAMTLPDAKTIKIAGKIDHAILKLNYPGVECFDISARTDKKQGIEFCIEFQTDFDPGVDGLFIPEFLTINADEPEWRFENSHIVNANQISGDPIPQGLLGLDGTTQTVQVCFQDFANVVGINFNGVEVCGTLDLTELPALSSYTVRSNDDLIAILLPTTSVPTTLVDVDLNPLLDNFDISVINLGGVFTAFLSSTLTTFTTGSSTEIITSFTTRNTSIQNLDLSGYTSMEGIINVSQHVGFLDSLSLPVTAGVFTSIQVDTNRVIFVDWTVLTGVSDGITITRQGNLMTAANVNHELVDLDASGWDNGILFIGGNNAPRDGVSGGFDGNTAQSNLVSVPRNWTINPI